MRRSKLSLASLLLVGGIAQWVPAQAQAVVESAAFAGSGADPFASAIVDDTSSLEPGFAAADAFGSFTTNPLNVETQMGGNVIFGGPGLSFINFHTAAPVAISGFKIFASGDGLGNSFRGFSAIRLFASDDAGATFTKLLGSAEYDPASGGVQISSTFDPLSTQYFRFEGDAVNGGGRLMEIDAIAAVPELATWAMMLVGFGAIGGALRRRQKPPACIRFA